MVKLLNLTLLLVGVTNVGAFNYLTDEDFDVKTAGKTMLIEFMDPDCENCKAIKPWWEKLLRNWNKPARVETSMMATVNCRNAQVLCSRLGIQTHPKFLWGNVMDLEEYDGEMTYDDVKKFALEFLKPVCGPTHLDLCDETTKKELEGYVNMPIADLRKAVRDKKAEIIAEAGKLNAFVKELNAEIKKNELEAERISNETDDKILKIEEEEGLNLMAAVAATHGPPPVEDPDSDKDFDDDEVVM